jgi:hypothetical protein
VSLCVFKAASVRYFSSGAGFKSLNELKENFDLLIFFISHDGGRKVHE